MTHRTARAILAVVLVGSLVLKLWHLGHASVKPWDEVFHAIVARNLLKHPLTPTLVDRAYLPYDSAYWPANHIWLHKPPMALWTAALSFKLLGVTPFALRLPSAILSTLAALLTYLIGVELLDPLAALIAATLQAFNPAIAMLVQGYLFSDCVDISLLFWTELAIYSLLRAIRTQKRHDLVLCGLAQGLAFLSKTWPALIVTGLAIVAWALSSAQKRTPSPGTPDFGELSRTGEGRGEGDFEHQKPFDFRTHPHPNPLPEYRERETSAIKAQVKPFRLRSIALILLATIVIALPWNLCIAIRFPTEFIAENIRILHHLNEDVEGWAGPWDRVLFDYYISIFHVFYPAILTAFLLLSIRAIRHRDPRLLFLLAWAVGVIAPHLLATSKTMSATLIAWPALWLLLGRLISLALAGDAVALGAWLTAMLLAAFTLNENSIPLGGGFGPAPPGFASILRQHPWPLYQSLAACAAGALLFLLLPRTSPDAGSEVPPRAGFLFPPTRRTLHHSLSLLAILATLLLLFRFWPGNHPRGYVVVDAEVSYQNKQTPAYPALAAFAAHLPPNAAFLVDENTRMENKLIEFATDRSCYALGPEDWRLPADRLAAAGALPYLVTARLLPLPIVLVDRQNNQAVYAATKQAAAAASR